MYDKSLPLEAVETEIDIECLSASGNQLFVMGSHSRKRKKAKDENNAKKNRKRLEKRPQTAARDKWYSLVLQAGAGVSFGGVTSGSLSSTLNDDAILSHFRAIPSKENGVDIEGTALTKNALYVGFRSPVLRGNLTPVLVFPLDINADHIEALTNEPERRFVALGGLGIRDLCAVSDGLLLLAGPPHDAPGAYLLFHWDGRDQVPGKRGDAEEPRGVLTTIGTIPISHAGHKAEGLVCIEESPSEYKVIVAYDGAHLGGLKLFKVTRDK